MAKLDVYERGSRISSVVIGPKGVTLGRGDDVEVRLDDKLVSRHHARVEPGDGGWVLEDLKTRNGTHVNGLREFRRSLVDGDRIELGPFVLVFSKDGGSPANGAPDLSWATPAPRADDDAPMSLDEATSVAGPREMARLRAESRLRLTPHLVARSGKVESIHPLREGETLIGRSGKCHVRVAEVGRNAAAVKKDADGYVVQRRGLFSSMLVNGEKQRRVKLTEGDTIELGEATFVFRMGAAPAR